MVSPDIRQRKPGLAASEADDVVVDDGESEEEVEYEDEPDEHEMSALDYLHSQGLSLKSLKDPSKAKTGATCRAEGSSRDKDGGQKEVAANVKAAMKARRKKALAEENEKQAKKEGGIKWMPLLFLLFMMGPAIFTAFDYLFQLPMFARFHRKPDMRQCLTNYYRKVSPDRLSEVNVDDILRKYKGRLSTMIRNLENRYRRKWQCP